MRLADTRPAFAGLANLTEQQLQSLPTPCYLLDEAQLRRNGQIMLELQQRTGCRALLAQKAFSNFDVYPALAPYLAGTEASGLYESRLGREQLPEKENHVFCAAYRADEVFCTGFHFLFQPVDISVNIGSFFVFFGITCHAIGKWCIGHFHFRAIYENTFIEVIDLFLQFNGMVVAIAFGSEGGLMFCFIPT